jgi:hypothetical protein
MGPGTTPFIGGLKMTKHAAWLLLTAITLAWGCGKASPPPPGAPTEKPEAPEIEGLDGTDETKPTTSEE